MLPPQRLTRSTPARHPAHEGPDRYAVLDEGRAPPPRLPAGRARHLRGGLDGGPARRQALLLADTGSCVQPTLAEKQDILTTAATVAQRPGAAPVRVAVMDATESVTEAMPETLDAAELQRLGEAGTFHGYVVQGPLSSDLAYAADSADNKRVGGAADVMLLPKLGQRT